MATYRNARSKVMINASQDKETPAPPSLPHGNVQDQEIVEDSLKDTVEAYQGGAVKTPQPGPIDDEDDLYGISPERQPTQKTKAAANGSQKEAPKGSLKTSSANEQSVARLPSGQQKQPRTSAPAADNVLTNANGTKPAPAKKSHTPKRTAAVTDDDEDALQVEDDGISALISSQARARSSKKQPLDFTSKDSALPTPSVSKAKASGKLSAVDALKARRPAQDGDMTSTTTPKIPVPDRQPAAKSKLGQSARAEETNNRQRATNEAQTRSAAGKLQDPKHSRIGQTPMGSQSAKHVGVRHDDDNDDGSDVLTKDTNETNRGAKLPATKGSSKASMKDEQHNTTTRGKTFDFQDDSESSPGYQPKKSTRKSKAAPATKKSGSTAKSISKAQERQSVEPPRRSARNAGQRDAGQYPQEEQPRRNSMTSRMKSQAKTETSDGRERTKPLANVQDEQNKSRREPFEKDSKAKSNAQAARTDHQPATSATSNMAAKDVRGKRHTAGTDFNEATSNRSEEPETIEEFEDAVVQYDDEEYRQDVEQKKALSRSNQGDSDKYVTMKQELPAKRASRTKQAKEQEAPARQTLGKSDEHPIALSDDEGDSSPVSSIHEQAVPQASQKVKSRSVSKLRANDTPTHFASTPPGTAAVAQQAGTDLSKKPKIVSFGASGPQNQGTASAKKAAQGPLGVHRSSVPPANGVANSNTSSRARLEDKVKKDQSSRGPSVMSFRSNNPASDSNVAGDVTDALDQFKKRSSSIKPQHDTEFVNIDDLDDPPPFVSESEAAPIEGPVAVAKEARSTHTAGRTKSQFQMAPPPPPESPKKDKGRKKSNIPAMQATKSGPSSKVDPGVKSNAATKRTSEKGATEERVSKRQCTSSRPDISSDARDKPTSTSPLMNEEPAVIQSQKSQMPNPVKRSRRLQTANRQASRGSQRVDVKGSPIPQGLDVEEQSTVLETYSQQVFHRSDTGLTEEVNEAKMTVTRGPQEVSLPEGIASSSHQVNRISSNKKRRPSGPHEESRGITKVKRVDSRQLLVEGQTGPPSTDPFTSSDESRKAPTQGSTSSNLIEQLRRTKSKPQPTRILPPPFQQDPDKTLVGEEPEYQSNRSRRLRSLSTSSSVTAEDEIKSAETIDDLGAWRNALQPHEMNLFDGLVYLSHQLVRTLVDKQTAMRDIVEDYRRQGLNVVEQLEQTHARECREYADNVKKRKKRLQREYVDFSGKLRENVASVEDDRDERKATRTAQADVVASLQELMAEMR